MPAVVKLFVLSMCMFLASMLFGLSPTVFTVSERHSHVLGAFGAGLLVGTALGVILPEGISEIYRVHAHHGHIEHHINNRQYTDTTIPQAKEISRRHLHNALNLNEALDDEHLCVQYFHTAIEGKNKLIGLSLVSGFIFMLLIDFVTGAHHQHGGAEADAPNRIHRGWMATIGLVVHSATDGIAMGAAVFADASVTAIVFMAVLIHKGPAAFGLSVYLLHNGLDAKRVRKHLLLFSCSAPLAAILTFFLVNQTADNITDSGPTNTIGILLLLSAGSFIFVATVHILPSITLQQDSNGSSFMKKWLSLELLCLLLGSALPLLLHIEHSH